MKKFRPAIEIIADINRCSDLIKLGTSSFDRTNLLYAIMHNLAAELENLMSPY